MARGSCRRTQSPIPTPEPGGTRRHSELFFKLWSTQTLCVETYKHISEHKHMNPCSNTRAHPGINPGNTQELTPTHTLVLLLLPAHPTTRPNIQLLGPVGPPLPGHSLPPSLEEGTAHRLPSTSAPAPPEFVCQAAGPLGRQPRSLSFGRSQEWLNQPSGELCISKS